jgi:hypothetical protein
MVEWKPQGGLTMSQEQMKETSEALDKLSRMHKGELQPPPVQSQRRRENRGFASALNATGPRRNRPVPTVRTGPVEI